MCRYANRTYKDHFACFRCPKAFKHLLWKKAPWGKRLQGPQRIARIPLCPQCRQPMADMGLDFCAPRKTDRQQWLKAALLFRHGITFHNCGCGAGRRPAKLQEVPAFVKKYHAEQLAIRRLRERVFASPRS